MLLAPPLTVRSRPATMVPGTTSVDAPINPDAVVDVRPRSSPASTRPEISATPALLAERLPKADSSPSLSMSRLFTPPSVTLPPETTRPVEPTLKFEFDPLKLKSPVDSIRPVTITALLAVTPTVPADSNIPDTSMVGAFNAMLPASIRPGRLMTLPPVRLAVPPAVIWPILLIVLAAFSVTLPGLSNLPWFVMILPDAVMPVCPNNSADAPIPMFWPAALSAIACWLTTAPATSSPPLVDVRVTASFAAVVPDWLTTAPVAERLPTAATVPLSVAVPAVDNAMPLLLRIAPVVVKAELALALMFPVASIVPLLSSVAVTTPMSAAERKMPAPVKVTALLATVIWPPVSTRPVTESEPPPKLAVVAEDVVPPRIIVPPDKESACCDAINPALVSAPFAVSPSVPPDSIRPRPLTVIAPLVVAPRLPIVRSVPLTPRLARFKVAFWFDCSVPPVAMVSALPVSESVFSPPTVPVTLIVGALRLSTSRP